MLKIKILDRLRAPRFADAPDRGYIPREGFYPDAEIQLSVAPHPWLYLPQLEDVAPDEAKEDLRRSWNYVLGNRIDPISGHSRRSEVRPLAFGPTTEQLFKSFIAPTIAKHCKKIKKNCVAADYVSYLLPFWSREELAPIQIVEGELSRLIKEGGKLPDNIGAVFLDFPPNQQKADVQYNVEQLLEFIKSHPDVLFVVDQANLYFTERDTDLRNDLMFTDLGGEKKHLRSSGLRDNDLCIVTNTTTKAVGLSGCAIAAGTARTKELLGQIPDEYEALFDDQQQLNRARQSLRVETDVFFFRQKPHDAVQKRDIFLSEMERVQLDAITASEFRGIVLQNKDRLLTHLRTLFGEQTTCPEISVGGARILINANALGFKNAKDLCDALYKLKIATKPASVYASPRKKKEWDKYVQMTVPWNEKMLNAVLEALMEIRRQKQKS